MLDTSSETALDDLARLAASICATPIAFISLTDREPGWCAARVGLEASAVPPDAAFVSLAAAGSDLLVVEDAAADPRFSADPVVTSEPRIRFYAGLALVSREGDQVLGALSVMDRVPRRLEPAQRDALRALGRQAVAQLEIRRQVRELDRTLAEVARAEEALRRTMTGALTASEAQVRAIVENVADGFVTYGEGGAIEIYNRAAERLFGYPPSQVLGRSIEMLVPGAVGDLKDGFHAEAEGRRADGTRFPIDLAISEMCEGDRHTFIAIIRDITAPRRTERRRAAEHAVTRILAESLTIDDAGPKILEAIGSALGWTCGAFWRIQRDAAVMRFAGTWHVAAHPPVAFLTATAGSIFTRGMELPGCVWESGRPEWIADLIRDGRFLRGAAAAQDGLRTGVAFPVVVGGEVRGVMELFARSAEKPEAEWLQMFAALGGQLGQFLERDEADRALRGSDERMRAVVENMLEGLITISERNIIEQVNPAAQHMFGYAAEELIGQHLKVLMPRSTAQGADAFLKDAAPRALGRITEWEGRRKNGELFRFELSLFAFQTHESRHFAGHLRDISERKKLERLKQEFVATVSHELRTPLTSIRGSLSLLTGGALGVLPDEARDVVAIAERNTVRLITLINDILDLERLEAGKLELHLEPAPLGPVIDRSVDSVRAFAEQQGIELRVAATNARVFGDGDRLVQVLVNLLSNAVKFSPRGASVTTSVVEKDGGAEVRVEDRGRGVPANQREAIFGRFQQVEAADSRQKGGTGLGLAICKAIVEQHGGTIGVESEPGRGSTFWFRIPSGPGPKPAPEVDGFLEALSGQEALGRDVLLADDDTALLGVLTRQLVQAGLPVRAARTAQEAVTEAARTPPALLVLDVDLPDASGFQVIETLRGRPESREIPVLVYSGRDLSGEERERLTLGPTRFLTKSRASDAQFKALVLELLQAPGHLRSEP
jgi:PAS domain S-box-containing protein